MEVDCPLRLYDKTVVVVDDAVVGWPPAADKAVAVVVVVAVVQTLAVGKLASVADDTVAVGMMVRAVGLG